MEILFISPYPPSRIRVRGYEVIQRLKRDHTITILAQVSSAQEIQDVERLQQQGYEVIPIIEPRLLACIRGALTIFTRYPLQVGYANSARVLHMARQLLKQRHFDIVHVEHLRGIASVESLIGTYPLVWDAVDCISRLWQKTQTASPDLKMRLLAEIEYKRTAAYEYDLVRKSTHIVTISGQDRRALYDSAHAYIPAKAMMQPEGEHEALIEVIPNGVDLKYFSAHDEDYRPYNIVFSGKMSYHANVAAALYLYHKIMPLIWQKEPRAILTIVGSNPPQSVQRMARDRRVEVTGYVDDIRPYVKHAHLAMIPMLYSVGIQSKVLEAMALGTPTVISMQAAIPLAVHHDYNTFIATAPHEFADYALQLMNDEHLRARIGAAGRTYVEEHHDWDAIVQKLVHLYQSVLATGQHAHTPSLVHAVSDIQHYR